MNEGLPSRQRIKTQKSFKALATEGRIAKGKWLILWVSSQQKASLEGNETSRPAIGIVVGRQFHKRATKRNLMKRRIREAFRRNQKVMKTGKAFLIKSKIAQTIPSYQEIEKDLLHLLEKTDSLL